MMENKIENKKVIIVKKVAIENGRYYSGFRVS